MDMSLAAEDMAAKGSLAAGSEAEGLDTSLLAEDWAAKGS